MLGMEKMSAKILVTGGAGYIGSHMVKMLGREGYRSVTFDNLATGHRDSVIPSRIRSGRSIHMTNFRYQIRQAIWRSPVYEKIRFIPLATSASGTAVTRSDRE